MFERLFENMARSTLLETLRRTSRALDVLATNWFRRASFLALVERRSPGDSLVQALSGK